MCVHMCICVYTCIHIYIYIYMYMCTHAYMYTYIYIYTCIMYMYAYIYIYIHTHIHISNHHHHHHRYYFVRAARSASRLEQCAQALSSWPGPAAENPRKRRRRALVYYTVLYYTILYYTILYHTISLFYTNISRGEPRSGEGEPLLGSASERAEGWGAAWAKPGHLAQCCYDMLVAWSGMGEGKRANTCAGSRA